MWYNVRLKGYLMGLVKTRRLAAMQKQTTYAKAMVVRQRAILLRQGYGGLKAGMKSRPPKITPPPRPLHPLPPHLYKSGGKLLGDLI